MTATITKTTANYTNGSATFYLSARSSTPASGSIATAKAIWWFNSGYPDSAGGIRYHHGADWVHTALANGERMDLLTVWDDGTEEWATPETLAVGSTFTMQRHVNATTGNDSTGDGSSGAPYQSIPRGLADWRAHGGGAGAEFILELSDEEHDHGAVTGGFVWNQNTLAAGGGSVVLGRVTFRGAGSNCNVLVPGTDVGVVNNLNEGTGFATINVMWKGDYVLLGSSVTGAAFALNRYGGGGDGLNFTMAGGGCDGFYDCIALGAPFGGTEMADTLTGEFDWVATQDATLGSFERYHAFYGQARYVGMHRTTFGGLGGAGTGSSIRMGLLLNCSFGGLTFDRTGSAYKGNVWRINGNDAEGGSNYVSVYDVQFRGTEEGIEFEQPSGPATILSYWFFGVHVDMVDNGGDNSPFQVSLPSGNTYDMTDVRFTCCTGRTTRNGIGLFRFATDPSPTTGKIHSVVIEHCGTYLPGAYGSFSWTASLLFVTGVNCDEPCFTTNGNYAYSAETNTTFSHAVCFIRSDTQNEEDIIAASDWNVSAKLANGGGMFWTPTQDIAAWRSATGFDANSSATENVAAHNFVNVTSGSVNLRPASDTGPQIITGYPGLLYTDPARGLFHATTPTAGPWQRGATLMADPDIATGPAAPTNLILTPTASSVGMAWDDEADDEDNYEVQYKASASGTWIVWNDALDPNTTSANITGLLSATSYDFRVRATNGDGDSAWLTDTIETLDVLPAAPSDVVVTPLSNSSLQVDWTDNSDNENTFVVEFKLATEPTTWSLWADDIAAGEETTTITGLATATEYNVRVRARNEIGDSSNANGSGTTDDVAPAAPSGITLTPGATSILVEWTDNSGNETAFEVDFKLATEPTTWTTHDHAIAANATSTTIPGLTPETEYDVRVRAANAFGNSSYDSDSATTLTPAPSPESRPGRALRLRLGLRL